MGLPEDLKHYGVEREDAFQLISEELAGAIIGAVVAALVVADIISHIWR